MRVDYKPRIPNVLIPDVPSSSKFSIRLVTADYYLNYPIPGLDVTFSEFRGTEVKQLPIIRVFGATEKGQKTCLHIHGVFPYLYIPCEEPNPEQKIAYKIANSIDKAINISLKQTNSQAQHVYKVSLVQGIPFYGFHTKPHQFFKIFFYNPSFVKRAADLLQNGAILGLSYQPHEAHINFTMQFFLDFNLYGMSYINIEYVKYRRKPNEGPAETQIRSLCINEDDFLPNTVPYTSTSECEVDCLAQHILNRRDVINGNLGANPGLKALWDDEKRRLFDMNMSEGIMPTPSQLRDNIKPTNSHIYHSNKLATHLAALSEMRIENSENSAITLSILNDSEITFEVKSSEAVSNPESGFLNSSVYPAETPEESQVMNATNVVLHHPYSISIDSKTYDQSTVRYYSETEVDETIVLQCSQRITASQIELDNDDINLMGMLKDMEGKEVEDDSILGTQEKCLEEDLDFLQQESNYFEEDVFKINEEKMRQDIDSSSDSVDSTKWQNSFWDNVENISQLDGAWDQSDKDEHKSKSKKRKITVGLSRPRKKSNVLPVNSVQENNSIDREKVTSPTTPKNINDFNKAFEVFHHINPKKSPRKSPKTTPKKARNFEPLNITVKKSPSLRQTRSGLRNKLHFETIAANLFKKNNEKSSRSLSIETSQPSAASNDDDILSTDSFINETVSDEILLRFESLSSEPQSSVDPSTGKDDQDDEGLKNMRDGEMFPLDSDRLSEICCTPKNTRSRRDDRTPILIMDSSPGDRPITSSLYDRINNFVPEAGPSKFDGDSNILSPLKESQFDESDMAIMSFYNTTVCPDSSIFYEGQNKNTTFVPSPIPMGNICSERMKMLLSKPSPVIENIRKISPTDANIENHCSIRKSSSECRSKLFSECAGVILRPKILPPSYYDIISTMTENNIPLCNHERPYYSNHKDVGGQIEIGRIVLKLRSKSVINMKEFQTGIPGINTVDSWRRATFMLDNLTQVLPDMRDINILLASNRPCVLAPCFKPPSLESVKNWLVTKSRNVKENSREEKKSEKITLHLPHSPGQESITSQMEIITLSPFSPKSQYNCTPEIENTPPLRKFNDSCGDKKSSQCSRTASFLNSLQKSTAKKRKFLSQQPKRKLRPRSLRLSLCSKNLSGSEGFDTISEGLSRSSGESEVSMACAQLPKSNLSQVNKSIENNQLDDKYLLLNDSEQKANNSESLQETGDISATLGFKFSGDNYQDVMVIHEHEYLTLLVLEVLTATRGNMNPDPEIDNIFALFYSIQNDCPSHHTLPQTETGIIFVNEHSDATRMYTHLQEVNRQYKTKSVKNELELIEEVLNLIKKWDPDILCGYEIELLSWGYLFQRGFTLNINIPERISKVSMQNKSWRKDSQEMNKDVKLIGRIMLDVWRLLRHEIALTSYTFENVMYHVMHERVPLFSFKTLSFWWSQPSGLLRNLSVEFYLTRVTGVIRILQQLDLIGRTSELARVFGIQWYEVLSRGSQFRVESMMIRVTRPRNFVLVSPSVQQRAAMKAPECLPLILEPESRFYSDPVIVLDFQSLYPSMMIAYNYCFSTCLGKVQNMGKPTPYEFGASQLKISPKLLEKLNKKDLINWSPCGVGFVKPAVRKGVLPIMLQDILDTRLMVKRAMKKHKDNKTLQKIFHSRQLGLKLIANVTYGYTAANFSGRMPCIEVGDSVVAKGRETLERAIHMVETTPKWNAKVVYGDTDSLFVLVPGRSRSDAFDIGAEIAEAVTDDNPTPVKLKLEKIYQPCILQTKKRYVGFMYESKEQKTPEYNAKGIETVRRDGCPATSKMLEKTLRILFETCDVSRVKSYICRKFQNIIEGKCNVRDFIFAKEFRGMNSYKSSASVPALEIARRLKAADHRKEPREGERLPYVITSGAPGEALLRLAYHPRELLNDSSLKLHHAYYITRVIIPPLNRCLTLIGADVNQWFAEMPRKQVQLFPILDLIGKQTDGKKTTISQYFAKVNCVGCDEQTTDGICIECKRRPQNTMLMIQNKINSWERKFYNLRKICQSCCGRGQNIECTSLDCPVLFRLSGARQDAEQTAFMIKMKQKLLDF